MLEAALVTFREGVESLLIIGILVAYLKKTQRAGLVKGVRIGLALSLVTCGVGAWLWLQVPNQSLYEGIAALTAAAVVGVLLVQMLRTGRQIKGHIEHRVGRMAGDEGAPASLRAIAGVALVTTLLVTREGLEAVFYLGVRAMAVRAGTDATQAVAMLVGALLGFAAAAFFAWSWTRWGHRLNLGAILKATALFLGLFLIQLVVYGVHELAESGVIHGSQSFHDATEMFGPDGDIGHWLSYSLVLAPLVYLLFARLSKPGNRPPPASTVRAAL
jgi:high-affinity iron transporter